MDLLKRIDNYNKTFPNYPPSLFLSDKEIIGLWVMGNNYQTKSTLYGSYPHGYLKRIHALFPKTDKMLHLFSGSINEGDCVDFKTGIDAETMSEIIPNNFYSLILSDCPYSIEDCEHYGCPMIKRNVVFNECYKIMEKNGILIWLDQVLPQYKKTDFKILARIGMVKSTNHRFRVITIFMKI